MNRIREKTYDLQRFLKELEEIKPDTFKDYSNSLLKKAACERYFEKIVEGIIDIAFLIIKDQKFELPSDDVDSLRIIKAHGIINDELMNKLKEAKGMRNIIIHQYDKINDELIYNAITNDIINDTKEFIEMIK